MTDPTAPQVGTRAGFAAILGAPNAGKSTLVNVIVGEKVSIVTHKVQTTRFPVRGVAIRDGAQIVLVDTPGVFAPKRRLDRAMVRAAWSGAADADVIVHVVDAADPDAHGDVARVEAGLKARPRPAFLALNKVDLVAKEKLLALAKTFDETGVYDAIFMISAKSGSGVADLVDAIVARMPEGPWLYPEDQVADLPQRLLAAEVTREKVYLRLHDELPYKSTVETDSWEERDDGSVRIEQTLFVEREGHRKIALGKGGQSIKAIGSAARAELEDMLGRRVHLFLHVKVRERWSEDRARYDAIGLDFDD